MYRVRNYCTTILKHSDKRQFFPISKRNRFQLGSRHHTVKFITFKRDYFVHQTVLITDAFFDYDKEIHWMFADMRESLCNRPINVLFNMLLIPCYTRVSIGNSLWRGSGGTLGRPCVVIFLWGSAELVVTSWSPTVVPVVISSWRERHHHISSLAIIKILSDIYTLNIIYCRFLFTRKEFISTSNHEKWILRILKSRIYFLDIYRHSLFNVLGIWWKTAELLNEVHT